MLEGEQRTCGKPEHGEDAGPWEGGRASPTSAKYPKASVEDKFEK